MYRSSFIHLHQFYTQALQKKQQDDLEAEHLKQKQQEEEEQKRIQQIREVEAAQRKATEEAERLKRERIERQKQIDMQLKEEALKKKSALIEQRKEELRALKRADLQKKAKMEEERRAKIAEKAAKKEKLQQAQTAAKSKLEQAKSTENNTPLGQHLDTLQSSLDQVKYSKALEQILKKVDAIMNMPHDASLLKIDLTSDSEFAQSVAAYKGGKETCQEIGFNPVGDNLETAMQLQMSVSAAQWERLVAAKDLLQKRITVLNHTAIRPQTETTQSTQSHATDDVDMLDEEAMLQQAIAMSMQQNQLNSNQSNNTDKKDNK